MQPRLRQEPEPVPAVAAWAPPHNGARAGCPLEEAVAAARGENLLLKTVSSTYDSSPLPFFFHLKGSFVLTNI